MELQEAFADYRYYLQMNAHKSPRTIVSYSHDLNDYLTSSGTGDPCGRGGQRM